MATAVSFIEYVCDQLEGIGEIQYKKMFGEYMVYLNDKPVLTVCDNTVFVKKIDCVEKLLGNADVGRPYEGAREHYVLNIDDSQLSKEVVLALEKVIPTPKSKRKK